jgi:hypothetical protein
MLQPEAEWISRYLAGQPADTLGTVLNLGSSTATFRRSIQPYIQALIFDPLKRRQIRVVHTDLKDEDGETLPADIYRDDDLAVLKALRPRTVLCSNMLEHVPSATAMATRIAMLVPSGGTLIVTVPRSYPYHPDPIDTLLRPDIEGIVAMFPDFALVEGTIVDGDTYLTEIRRHPSLLARRLARTLLPLLGARQWLSALDRWRWLFRRYAISCAVLAKAS